MDHREEKTIKAHFKKNWWKPILMGTFLLMVGYGIGNMSAKVQMFKNGGPMASMMNHEHVSRMLYRVIEPTDEQRILLDSLIEEQSGIIVAFQKGHMQEVVNHIEQFKEKIKPILTDEQIKKLEEKEKKIKGFMEEHKGAGHCSGRYNDCKDPLGE